MVRPCRRAPKADQAIWSLVSGAQGSVAFLKERLQVVPAPADQLAKMIADLDSDKFALRQQAAKALDDLGEAAEGAMRKSLEGNSSLEGRQRIEQFLQKRNKDAIRKLRALDAVEQIGTSAARQVLVAVAKTSPNPRVSEAANAALERLAKR